MDKNRLEVRLFGNVTIKLNNEDITGKLSGKSIAIICILMLQRNHRISRTELIEYLWPKSSDEAAKYNLRYNIWQLKKHLRIEDADRDFASDINTGEKTEEGVDLGQKDISGSSFIITTKDMCYINKDWEYYCDFTEIISIDIKDSKSTSLSKLRELCDSITGSLMENCFFEGCDSLDELILVNRYMIENRELKLLDMLAERLYEEKLYDECVLYLDRCLKLDPYSSKNARMQMGILIEKNKMQEAKKFYNNYCKTLAFDLELEPEPEIVALAEQIKSIKISRETIQVVVDESSIMDFSAISQIINKMLEHESFDIIKYMQDQYVMEDLASISLPLARKLDCKGASGQPVRIGQSFKDFVEAMIKDKVILWLEFDVKADKVSAEIIDALAQEHRESVRIVKDK